MKITTIPKLPEPFETLYCVWLAAWAYLRRPLWLRKVVKIATSR
jgi:hypothetical protein